MRSQQFDARSAPLVNIMPRPRPLSVAGFRHSNNSVSGTRTQSVELTGGPGTAGWWVWNWTGAANGVDRGGDDLIVSEINPPVIPGEIYSGSMWVMPSRATLLRPQAQFLQNATGSDAGTANAATIAVPGNVPTLLTFEGARAGSLARYLRFDVDHGYGAAIWQPGDSFRASKPTIVRGPRAIIPVDGSDPGWTYIGDTASVTGAPSAGYVQTLDSIAGKPFLDSRAFGSENFPGRTFPNGATMIVVADRPAFGDTFAFSLRNAAGTQRLNATGTSNFGQVVGQVDGYAQTPSTISAMAVGRNAIAVSIAPDMSTVRGRHHLDPSVRVTELPGAPSVLFADTLARSAGGTGRTVRVVVWDRELTRDEREAALRLICHEEGATFVA